MTLGHDLAAVLPSLRAEAQSRMTETVRIGRVVELDEPDPVTLEPVRVFDVVYEGAARIKFTATGAGVSDQDVAGQLVAVQRPECHLPSGTAGIETDMAGVVDSSTADGTLAGLTFRIQGFPESGQTTAARFPITLTGEELPEEGS